MYVGTKERRIDAVPKRHRLGWMAAIMSAL
jgi:hypothetical protein